MQSEWKWEIALSSQEEKEFYWDDPKTTSLLGLSEMHFSSSKFE